MTDLRRSARGWGWLLGLLAVMATAGMASPAADQGSWTAGERLHEPHLLAAVYGHAGFRPFWESPARLATLRAWIARTADEGLEPDDYHHAALARPELEPLDRELLATDAFLTLALHLATGKTLPGRLFPGWNFVPGVTPQLDPARLATVLAQGQVGPFLDGLLPQAGYAGLREAFRRYRWIVRQGGWPVVPPGATLRPGDRGEGVRLLRRRLALTGDLVPAVDGDLFDEALEAAVRRFQRRHFLAVDGVVGRRTLAALNVPAERRLDQLRVNLERLRWLHHTLPPTYLRVEVPAFTLWRIEDGQTVWRAAVQIGRPRFPTPIFRSRITYLVFNPTWTVPRSIARRELVPKLLQDPPGFLRRHRMELLTPGGEPVDPAQVDWNTIDPRTFPFVLRQRPGPGNALGRVKFMFPNRYHVYLHDTPNQALFQRPRRAFSHGCIRVADALTLAQALLIADGDGWRPSRIQALLTGDEPHPVVLKRPLPIYLLYLTAAVDEAGAVQFRSDLYRRDTRVLRALAGEPGEKAVVLGLVDD